MGKIIEIFGLDWRTMLVSLGGIILLVAALYLLLFKPVKKLIAEKRAKAQEAFLENERLNKEVLAVKEKYAQMTADAAEKIEQINHETQKAAAEKAQQIVDDAKQRAHEMVVSVRQDLEAERARLEEHFKAEIMELSVELAGKVLEREVQPLDDKKLIDECLEKWS